MLKRYAIWDKKTQIITPVLEVLSPAQWIERYPAAALSNLTVVCSAGEINGGFFGVLSQMVSSYESQGCDFSECHTDEEKLQAIEDFEDALSAMSSEPSAEERIAAALEYQIIAAMEDTEV